MLELVKMMGAITNGLLAVIMICAHTREVMKLYEWLFYELKC